MTRIAIARGASPSRQTMLGIYLNDHLAGATAGVELARRLRASNEDDPEFGPALADGKRNDVDHWRVSCRAGATQAARPAHGAPTAVLAGLSDRGFWGGGNVSVLQAASTAFVILGRSKERSDARRP